jgi:hypothetical protein
MFNYFFSKISRIQDDDVKDITNMNINMNVKHALISYKKIFYL